MSKNVKNEGEQAGKSVGDEAEMSEKNVTNGGDAGGKSVEDGGEAPKMSLNQKIAKLDTEVEWFYSDDFKLEEATEKYREAAGLAKEIEQDLTNLKNEIEILTADFSK